MNTLLARCPNGDALSMVAAYSKTTGQCLVNADPKIHFTESTELGRLSLNGLCIGQPAHVSFRVDVPTKCFLDVEKGQALVRILRECGCQKKPTAIS